MILMGDVLFVINKISCMLYFFGDKEETIILIYIFGIVMFCPLFIFLIIHFQNFLICVSNVEMISYHLSKQNKKNKK